MARCEPPDIPISGGRWVWEIGKEDGEQLFFSFFYSLLACRINLQRGEREQCRWLRGGVLGLFSNVRGFTEVEVSLVVYLSIT